MSTRDAGATDDQLMEAATSKENPVTDKHQIGSMFRECLSMVAASRSDEDIGNAVLEFVEKTMDVIIERQICGSEVDELIKHPVMEHRICPGTMATFQDSPDKVECTSPWARNYQGLS